MSELLPPGSPGGVAGALGTLRHALADPLSAAGLKLELLERRMAAAHPDDPSLPDRVRGARADLALAGRLIDLLPRLALIDEEAPGETTIGELCRSAGIPVDDEPAARAGLLLRRLASVDAVRTFAGLLRSPGPPGSPVRARAEALPGRLSLLLEELDRDRGWGNESPERLLHLPPGVDGAEELFLSRVGVEADGGLLQLSEKDGRRTARLSWPA